MGRIDPRQYVRYDRWCRAHGAMSRLREAQTRRLRDLDERCLRCSAFPVDNMLCEGTRLVFDPDAGPPGQETRLVMARCHKWDVAESARLYRQRLRASYIPDEAVRAIEERQEPRAGVSVEAQGGSLAFGGVCLEPYIYALHCPDLVASIREYMVAAIRHGFQAVYLFTVDHYRMWTGKSLADSVLGAQRPLLDCHWLVIDHLDFSTAPAMQREALFAVAQARVDQGKPLTLVQPEGAPKAQTEAERTFFEEAMSWPSFNLE